MRRVHHAAECVIAVAIDVRDQLHRASVPRQPLAELIPAHRRLLIPRPARMRRIGEVWSLGVFLLDEQARLYVAGATTRARRPVRVGYAAESARERDEVRIAAHRGGFPDGQVVHYDATRIDLREFDRDAGPLRLDDGQAVVRWAPLVSLGNCRPFAEYVRERVELLLEQRERH